MFRVEIGGRVRDFEAASQAAGYAVQRCRECYSTLEDLIREIWTWEKAKRDYNRQGSA